LRNSSLIYKIIHYKIKYELQLKRRDGIERASYGLAGGQHGFVDIVEFVYKLFHKLDWSI